MESSFEKIRFKKMENMKIWRKKNYEQKCGEKKFQPRKFFFSEEIYLEKAVPEYGNFIEKW